MGDVVEPINKTRADTEEDGYPAPFNVTFIPERIGTFIIDIDAGIGSVGQFDYAIKALNQADERTPVVINLQCPGGSLGATDALVHAMRKCEAPIHIVATGGCHSAATLILLEADSFELSEGFHALIHCGSLGTGGNLNEYVSQTNFFNTFLPKIFRSAYEGFLTDAEIDKMLDGKDIILDADGWMDRAMKRLEYFQAKAEGKLPKADKPTKKPRTPKKKAEVEVPAEN